MAFTRQGDTITISAELKEDDADAVLMAFGITTGLVFEHLGNRSGWRWMELLNQLFDGSGQFQPYAIPADRTTDFIPRHIHIDVVGG